MQSTNIVFLLRLRDRSEMMRLMPLHMQRRYPVLQVMAHLDALERLVNTVNLEAEVPMTFENLRREVDLESMQEPVQ